MKQKVIILISFFIVANIFPMGNIYSKTRKNNNTNKITTKKTRNAKKEKINEIEALIQEWKSITKSRLSYNYIPPNFDPFEPIRKKMLKPAPINKDTTIFFKEYSLNDLKLVGIVESEKRFIAIIEDPLGRGFFLEKGDYLGKEAGIITKITKCKVYISRKYIDYKGNIIFDKHPKILNLHGEDKACLE